MPLTPAPLSWSNYQTCLSHSCTQKKSIVCRAPGVTCSMSLRELFKTTIAKVIINPSKGWGNAISILSPYSQRNKAQSNIFPLALKKTPKKTLSFLTLCQCQVYFSFNSLACQDQHQEEMKNPINSSDLADIYFKCLIQFGVCEIMWQIELAAPLSAQTIQLTVSLKICKAFHMNKCDSPGTLCEDRLDFRKSMSKQDGLVQWSPAQKWTNKGNWEDGLFTYYESS